MLIEGKCHCGNISLQLQLNEEPAALPARACGCTFCTKHGAVWTSSPGAELEVVVRDETLVPKYAFGTRTAPFLVCARCGVVPVAICEIEGRLCAVVNVNTLENIDPAMLHRTSTDFDAENVETRLARRKRNWIPNVRIRTPGS